MSLLPKCICGWGSHCHGQNPHCPNKNPIISTPSPKDQPEGQRLNLDRFSELNRNRAAEGFKTYKNVPITYWTTALAGEVGELCNMIKKQERVARGGIDGGSSYTAASLTPEDLKEEIGGIFIYLDLLSGLLGIDLTDAIIHTFNSKSEKYGFAQKYTSETSSPASEAGMSQEDFDRQRKYKPFTGKEIGTIGYNPESGDLRIEPYGDEVPPTEKALAAQGEIPEEIRQWIKQRLENMSSLGPMAIAAWEKGAIAMYDKMQEEIQEYRKALQNFVDKVDRGEARSKRSYAEMKDILAKYPQGKEGGV